MSAEAPKPEQPIRVVVPEPVDVQLSLDNLPEPLATAVQNLAKPAKPSRIKSVLKDYLPVLTPIATAVISVSVAYYTYISDHDRSKEALDKALTEFGEKTDDRARAIAAIKLAAYGDKALPAVKMVLGAEDDRLRSGGVLVAEQMYRAETVDRQKLIDTLLEYYEANDPTLRRGVLEWLEKMGYQLSQEDYRRVLAMLQKSFGRQGQDCAKQEKHVAMEATNFLQFWLSKDSVELLKGMAEKCPSDDVKRQAGQALQAISGQE